MKFRPVVAVIVILALLVSAVAVLADSPPYSEEEEQAAGKEVCAAVEKEYDLWEDEAAQKKVNTMVNAIAVHTQRPDVKYNVKLLDTDEVNAFSVPGGNIYVCRGLLDTAQSDDELAAVLAHEMAHNCTYDAMKQAERNQDMFMGSVGAALAAIFMGASSEEVAGVLQAGGFLRQGLLSKYSKEMEERADKNAISYLKKTEYDPVGLLTFMERLLAKEAGHYRPDYGIFETHPGPIDRRGYIIQTLYDAGIEINRRAVTDWQAPKFELIRPGDDENADPTAAEITLWDIHIVTIRTKGHFDSIKARAEAVCNSLKNSLAAGLERYEVQKVNRDDHVVVELRKIPMIAIGPEDVAAAKEAEADGAENDTEQITADTIADGVVNGIAGALHYEALKRRHK